MPSLLNLVILDVLTEKLCSGFGYELSPMSAFNSVSSQTHNCAFEIGEKTRVSTGLLAQPVYFCLAYKFLNKLEFIYDTASNFAIKALNVLRLIQSNFCSTQSQMYHSL